MFLWLDKKYFHKMIDFQVSFQTQDTFSIQLCTVENPSPFSRILHEFCDESQIEEFPDYLSGKQIISFHVQDHIKSKTDVSADFFGSTRYSWTLADQPLSIFGG